MRFICDKGTLYEAITNVSKAVAEKSTIACLEGIKADIKGNVLTLTGYDLEMGIETQIEARSDDVGSFVLNSRLFADIIKRMGCDTVDIEVYDNLQVKILGGNTEYHIAAISASEYPELPSASECESISVQQSVLKSMINMTCFAAAQTDMKPILKGELFDIKDGVFNLVALDGHKLAVRTEPMKTDKEYKFVVPAKTLMEIAKLLKDEDGNVCEIKIARKHIIFEFSGYTVYSRILEGEFHPYKKAIPTESAITVIADTKKLIESLDRAMLLINERMNSPVKFLFENGKIDISCSTSVGNINDTIDADITGPMLKIGFNCRYMLDTLKAAGDEKVKMLFNGSQLPLKLVPANGGEEYTYLVLPMRLQG